MKEALLIRKPIPQKQKVPPRGRKKRVLVIAGPTGAGKTALSLSLAAALGGEIISADSMQVYRGMDIGTAKALPEERAAITHHLVDICDLRSIFNVAEFYKHVQEAFREILARENVPIVVGGSGFYIHALLYGPPQGPPSNPEVREQLEKQMRDLGPEVLYERLQMFDPHYAATISECDRHKIIRALEIMALSEKRVSDFPKPQKLEQEYDFRCWFLYYPKETLYARIEKRCEEMVQKGLLDEVKALEKEGLRNNPTASQAIGYRQALEYLSSPQTPEDHRAFIASFKKASRQYSKRQFTWFRKEPLFRWLNIESQPIEMLKELILQDFEVGD
ncbi:MAG: tRNA (adenosine(37)-N6)-dimethylallyltransferase MiaA [Verrucomicrobia bacterium]|nr:tRNA (adenosine(37)-N6)-dimethylallyltransferase MiaA [Verrucomicrobiota bacterium]MBU6446218.1 tRNA (adenosine(37)-N6)-dimethylallyltransferase MiaA [Verrucomicrobiota bacterium]MDE3047149.1 tRNA (adenosine(37)-N6)-dimethylallyltransferase MiaA [Verrucomicrobiota bacterium]